MKKLLIIPAILISLVSFGQKQSDFHLDENYDIDLGGTIYLSTNDAKITISGEDRKDVGMLIKVFVEAFKNAPS